MILAASGAVARRAARPGRRSSGTLSLAAADRRGDDRTVEGPAVIKQTRSRQAGTCTLTFALPAEEVTGAVSVVGTFNDWTPGQHVLKRRSNGTASASVVVPGGTTVRFRYLAEHGRWFDDHAADVVTADGSVVHV
ncbi:hypothetical protein Cma02nite_20090 [Cellulomonas marina]|uniref:Carbohydrate-binding module 48 (Isoamylase N-terminal domain) n=1 Tax=Cellulomonas marina TaxID=988821 RepID=A0A1I1A027_9CELL|nr:hypothetical protein Cma02nite_20090 [Cellulomonas marina]SFB29960.1 hypothetical protein SAMN05421867_11350 [Cellulomonas marina]